MVEQLTVNQLVGGSNPSRGAILRSKIIEFTKIMKVFNSLKSAKNRDKNCKVVRRKGRLYVINKLNPRFKARQG